MIISAGQLIDDKYEVIAELGEGGMGRVYKARQLDLDRLVAIKVLFPNAINTSAHGRLEREALALAQLSHPGVVSIYGFGVCEAGPYLVMEYVEGTPLSKEIGPQGLGVQRSLAIMANLCEAVGYTHRHGIVHRDLKPDNILIVGDPAMSTEIKMIDLGMARFLPASGKSVQRLTETGFAVGSVMYMSPEECFAQPADCRSDIYSLGVIFYECLTGFVPFKDSNMGEIMLAHVNKTPAPLLTAIGNDELPGLQNVVFKAMAKRPDQRYQNSAEMLDHIELVRKGKGREIPKVTAHAGTTLTSAKAAKRWPARSLMLGVVSVVVVVSLGLGVYLYLNSGPSSLDMFNEARRLCDLEKPDIKPDAVEKFAAAIKRDSFDKKLSTDQKLYAYTCVGSHSKDYARTAEYAFEAVRLGQMQGYGDTKIYALMQCLGWTVHHELIPIKRTAVIAAVESALKLRCTANDMARDEVIYHLARTYFGDGQFSRAEELATELEDKHADQIVRQQLYPILGGCYLRAGDSARAADFYEARSPIDLVNDEDEFESNCIAALACLAQGEIDKAKSWIGNTAAEGTTYSGVRMLLAARTGDSPASEKFYLKVLSVVQKHPSKYYSWFLDYDLAEYANLLRAAGKEDLAKRTELANEQALAGFKATR